MAAFALILRRFDRVDRDPMPLLAFAFLWGALGAVSLGIVGSTLLLDALQGLGIPWTGVLSTVLVAPLSEEPAKAMGLAILTRSRSFHGLSDGFLWGATVGLGFAMTENFLYFCGVAGTSGAEVWIQTVVIRTLYSGVMHATATAVTGAAIAYTKPRSLKRPVAWAGLTAACAIHALWNGLLAWDEVATYRHGPQVANLVLFPIEVAFVFSAYLLSIHHELQVLRRLTARWPLPAPPETGWTSADDRRRGDQTRQKLALRWREAQRYPSRFFRAEILRLERELRELERRKSPRGTLAPPR